MKKIFYFILFFLITGRISAQSQEQKRIDSLQLELSKAKGDTTKVNVLNSLSWEYYTKGKPDTAFSYAQEALRLSQKLKFKKGTATASRYMGNHYADLSDTENALEFYRKALNISKEIDDKQGIISNLRNIGLLYADLSDFPNAMENYRQALHLAEEIKYQALTITVYKDIGRLTKRFSNYPLALENYQQALRISEKSGDKQNTAEILTQIGWIYRDLGDADKALDFLNRSLAYYLKLQDQMGASKALFIMGNIYMNINEYEKSLEYFNRSSEIKEEINDEYGLATNYANVAFLYQLLSDYTTAIKYHQSSLLIFNKFKDKFGELLYYKDMGNLIQIAPDSILLSINIDPAHRYQTAIDYETHALKLANEVNDSDQKAGVLNFLITAYEKQGDFKSAYFNLQAAYSLYDSIQGQSTREEIVRKEMQYDFEKKEDAARAEQEKKDIRQRNIRNSSFAVVGAMLLFSLIVVRQRNKVKKEKQRSDNLLLNILPEEVADELKAKGNAEARQFDEVSVLFTDFVHFTQVSEKLSPQELVQELNECFTAFDNIIERNGLEKIKTIGDAYMAVCGLPTSDPKHAQKTVQAALEIRDFIEERRQAPQGLGVRPFAIRIGVNSGSVVAGIVGVKKFAYDIWGDTVNTAARMEQNGEAGKVNISETTYELVKNDFNCSYRGKIEAKGKGEVDMYFVISENIP